MKHLLLLFIQYCVFNFISIDQARSEETVTPLEKTVLLPPQPIFDDEGQIKYYPRIVGGKKAHDGDVPALVSIQTRRGTHFCGGAWFKFGNGSYVLTAAHCVVDSKLRRLSASAIQVMGDDISVAVKPSTPRRQVRRVSKIVAHSDYRPYNLNNDIALLHLTSPFKETKTFAPITVTNKTISNHQRCTIAGWGSRFEKGPPTVELLIAEVLVVPKDICNSRRSYNGAVSKNAFCAGSMAGGTDTCQGDSGGGVFSNNTLVGVVSFGFGCGRERFPGVYTNVYDYRKWIEGAINSSPISQPYTVLMAVTIAITYLTRLIFY